MWVSALRRASLSAAIASPRDRTGIVATLCPRSLAYRRDIEEADPPLEKRCHRNFVRRIEHGRRGAAVTQGGVRQSEAGKTLGIRVREVECADTREVERSDARVDALRPSQRLGDRRAHVGIAQLR